MTAKPARAASASQSLQVARLLQRPDVAQQRARVGIRQPLGRVRREPNAAVQHVSISTEEPITAISRELAPALLELAQTIRHTLKIQMPRGS